MGDFNMSFNDLFTGDLPEELTKQETFELLNKVKQGDMNAREQLINCNIRLVLYCVLRYFMTVEYDKEELVAIGCVGLIKAVDTFDLSKRVEFSTYVSRCINNEIRLFLRKLKGYKNDASFEDIFYFNKDGDDIKLLDVIPSELDIEEEYIEKDYREFMLGLLQDSMESLNERDKKIIMLYFGFCNNKEYSQQEIADMMNISRSMISRIINRGLEKLGKNMKLLGSCMDVEEINNKLVKGDNRMKRLQTIYEYFSDYTREEINEMIERLSGEDRELLRLRYGDDLDNPVSAIDNDQRVRFYSYLVPKMRRLLANIRNGKNKVGSNKIVEERINDNTKKQSIDKNDYVNMLEMLKSSTFEQMLGILSVKEAIIVSLRFGYVDGKYFDTKDIASFLDISEDEVRDITTKALLLYKDNINDYIDKAINIVSSNTLKRSKSN